MVIKELRERLDEIAEEQDIPFKIFDNHAYDKSIIGLSVDCRLVYSYEKMVKEFMEDEGCDETDAIEWIEYNTIRSLPYLGDHAPIIVYDLEGF